MCPDITQVLASPVELNTFPILHLILMEVIPQGSDKTIGRFSVSLFLCLPEAALERVPWVPVNPSIFQTSYVKAVEILENIKKPLKKWRSENPLIEIPNAAPVSRGVQIFLRHTVLTLVKYAP